MKFILVFLLSLFLFTTNCDQKFALLGITHGYTTTIWIQEDVGGECSYTMLRQVIIDTGGHVYRSSDDFSGDSVAMREFIRKNLAHDSVVEVKKSGGAFSVANIFSLSDPKDNVRLRQKFENRGDFPSEWNRTMGDSGLVKPVVSNGNLDLLYVAPEGFYVNYSIYRTWYSPSAHIVIIFTRGSEWISGDTSNGYMVFRVRSPK